MNTLPIITHGPIVSLPRDNKVRILLECKGCKTMEIYISAGKQPKHFSRQYSLITTIELLNNEPHVVIFNQTIQCSFDPMIKSVAIFSCDGGPNGSKSWSAALRENVTHAIHVGDQVYADSAYETGMARFHANGGNIKRIFDEEIRAIYHKTWFQCKEKQEFLATHCNFMMIDDHDLYDNFTSPKFDWLHMSIFMDVAATIANQYQIGLCYDVNVTKYSDLTNVPTVTELQTDHTKFVILNSRLMKTPTQMFETALVRPLIKCSKQRKLVVVDQVSPFVVAHPLTKFESAFQSIGIDITDHVTYNPYWIKDYEWLFHKMMKSNAKELVYVTGDLHVGQDHHISNKQGRKIHCFTSSPISSPVAFQPKYNFRWLLSKLSHTFTGLRYTNSFICYPNFVVISDHANKHTIV